MVVSKKANCGCMGHQLPCTMFSAWDGGRACLNPFIIADTDEAVNQNVDTDNDHEKDVLDDSIDENDNV